VRRLLVMLLAIAVLGLWVLNAGRTQQSVQSDEQTVVAQMTVVAGPTLTATQSE
jgi:hypothetical protein